ncbi:hypothetical protein [Streptomyces sp. NPDC101165]|uniref:hypothetical protein n=1 Tax=Streptomyces sp. NPDC101165 TaxID=3366119 RepID=UPI003813B46E
MRGRTVGATATLLHASASADGGAVAFAERDLDRTLPLLHRALAVRLGLGVPYEAAQVRMALAAAERTAGDAEGARTELRPARQGFEELGAAPAARRAAALLAGLGEEPPGQVLRLVAAGRTNRSIAAEPVISEHTLARAAATAYACTQGLT